VRQRSLVPPPVACSESWLGRLSVGKELPALSEHPRKVSYDFSAFLNPDFHRLVGGGTLTVRTLQPGLSCFSRDENKATFS
jgi:hypothetical protein